MSECPTCSSIIDNLHRQIAALRDRLSSAAQNAGRPHGRECDCDWCALHDSFYNPNEATLDEACEDDPRDRS
jgi:hypothetical protein